jgi:hypothetical protein
MDHLREDAAMSLHDYEVSRFAAEGVPFAGLIMAAMHRADTANLTMLKDCWPDVWAELDARYNAPGGVLPGDPDETTSPVT